MKRLVAIGVLACLAGCGSTASRLTGTWTEAQSISIPGAKLILVLSENGGVVSGIGDYTIEAGRSGTLRISGTFNDPTVSLALVYDFGSTASFSGTLVSATRMEGTFGFEGSGDGVPAAFDKQ